MNGVYTGQSPLQVGEDFCKVNNNKLESFFVPSLICVRKMLIRSDGSPERERIDGRYARPFGFPGTTAASVRATERSCLIRFRLTSNN